MCPKPPKSDLLSRLDVLFFKIKFMIAIVSNQILIICKLVNNLSETIKPNTKFKVDVCT